MSLLDKFLTPTPAPKSEPRPNILETLGVGSRSFPDAPISSTVRGDSVGPSRDLARVLELPRRPRPVNFDELRSRFAHLQKSGACLCESRFHRRCANRLNDTQAWGLVEIQQVEGLLGPIAVGDGKTLLGLLAAMVMPHCRVAVLLIPPQLRDQLLKTDWDFYGQHWHLPNLGNGRWFDPNKPTLHVVAYSELSTAKNSDILDRINPDLIIADEAHLLRNAVAARTKRFKRFFSSHPDCRFCCWSGTLTTRSLKDYAHLSGIALGDGAPTPLHWPTVEEWAGALDPSDWPTGIGDLSKFCDPGEHVRDGFRRRLECTAGVVSSPATMSCPASLTISERPVETPKGIHDALGKLYGTWQRPDGEELVSALDIHRCAKEISSGFYYHWIWPRQEALEIRKTWLNARKEWHRELREKLKHSREFMDSPLLLTKAAIRWFDGYVHIEHTHTHGASCYNYNQHGDPTTLKCERPTHENRIEVPPFTKHGPLPTWESETWLEWKAKRDTAEPETEGVWIDEFLARDAAAWAGSNLGIVWSEHDVFGRRVAQLADRPYYGAGADASARVITEGGSRAIVASIRAHGTGKNLQAFARNLFANVPSDAAQWEQALGRTHRQGQLADEVTVEIYQHTPPVREALQKARMYAQYIEQTMGGSQKLLRATWVGI